WVGCNILILFDKIPAQGRIPVVQEGVFLDKKTVFDRVNQAKKIKTDDIVARGWLMDILHCVNSIDGDTFHLSEVYAFENDLEMQHPNNNNIRAKIRQQLQQLRDRSIISFLGKGYYKKNPYEV